MNKLIEDYKNIYGEFNDKMENSLLLKINEILRTIIIFANKNSSIEKLVEKNKLILEEFKKLDELIEKESDINLKDKIINLIKQFQDCDRKLNNIKEYNKFQFIINELNKLNKKNISYNKPKVNDINYIERLIENNIELLKKYDIDKDQELVDAIFESKKKFKGLLNNIKEIKIIYNNYHCSLESEKYLKKSQDNKNEISLKK